MSLSNSMWEASSSLLVNIFWKLVSPSYGMIRSMDGKKEQTLYFEQTGEPVKNPRVIFAKRSNTYFFNAVWAWFGKMQFTGFTPRPDDETQEVPITPIQ